jgi:hypothetical protein
MRALNLLIEKRWTNLFRYLNAIQNAKLDDRTKMMSLQKLRRGSPRRWKLNFTLRRTHIIARSATPA